MKFILKSNLSIESDPISFDAEWTPERLHSWAASIGESTATLIDEVIKLQTIPEQSFRSCLGILRMGKLYGTDRLENAAVRALHIGSYRYKSIESILKNGLDQQPLPLPASETTAAVTATLHDMVWHFVMTTHL